MTGLGKLAGGDRLDAFFGQTQERTQIGEKASGSLVRDQAFWHFVIVLTFSKSEVPIPPQSSLVKQNSEPRTQKNEARADVPCPGCHDGGACIPPRPLCRPAALGEQTALLGQQRPGDMDFPRHLAADVKTDLTDLALSGDTGPPRREISLSCKPLPRVHSGRRRASP